MPQWQAPTAQEGEAAANPSGNYAFLLLEVLEGFSTDVDILIKLEKRPPSCKEVRA